MRKLKSSALFLPVVGFTLSLLFQNCDGGFQYDPLSGELSSLGDMSSGPLGAKVFATNGTAVNDATDLATGASYEMRATGSNLMDAILLWSIGSINTANCNLTSTGDQVRRELRCTSEGSVQVRVEAVWSDGTQTQALINRAVKISTPSTGATPDPRATPDPTIPDPDRVDFRIRAGTGTGAWNTAGAPVIVFVGQTLRIFNDDSVPHRLVTTGSPCASHPADIAPNSYADCLVTATHAADATDLRDRDGATPAFFVYALNGEELYQSPSKGHCYVCHGEISVSNKKTASFMQIKNAIMNRDPMKSIVLTDDEIRAISYRLSKPN